MDEEEGRQLADEIGSIYIKASAKDNINVNEAFELLLDSLISSEEVSKSVEIKVEGGGQSPAENLEEDLSKVKKLEIAEPETDNKKCPCW